MKSRRPFPSCLLCLLLLLDPRGHAAEDVPLLDLTFSVFPLQPGTWTDLVYAPNGDPTNKVQALHFNPRERSASYEYKGPSPLVFYRVETVVGRPPLYRPVAALPAVPATGGDNWVLFFEPTDPPGRYTITGFLDTPETFPNESIVFVNTMDLPLLGMLGDTRLDLQPGYSPPVDVRPFFEKEAPIALAVRHEGELHLVAQNRMRFSPDRRTLMILRRPSKPGSLRIRTQRITEFTGALSTNEVEKLP